MTPPLTLRDYLLLTALVYDEGSPQHRFIAAKIASSPRGEKEEVLADESQMLALFNSMTEKKP